MNQLQHLLLKLNEECVEVAFAATELKGAKLNANAIWQLADKAVDMDLEINDLNAVIRLLNKFYNFSYVYDKKHADEEFIRQAMHKGFEYWSDKIETYCLEVAKLSSKAMQFGLLERHPNLSENNLQRIHKALDDLYIAITVLVSKFNLPYKLDQKKIDNKMAKIMQYLDYSFSLGMVHQGISPADQYPATSMI